ncbi:Os08g0373850, partial [Oryza sativa Japonica Group]
GDPLLLPQVRPPPPSLISSSPLVDRSTPSTSTRSSSSPPSRSNRSRCYQSLADPFLHPSEYRWPNGRHGPARPRPGHACAEVSLAGTARSTLWAVLCQPTGRTHGPGTAQHDSGYAGPARRHNGPLRFFTE